MERISSGKALATAATAAFIILILAGEDCDECFEPSVMALKAIAAGLAVICIAMYYHYKFLGIEKILFCVDRQPVLSAAMATEGVPYSSEGTLVPIETMISPIAKRECVYYHLIKERWEKQGKHEKWVIKENVMAYKPFYVEDKSGRLLVDAMNVDHDFSEVILPITNSKMPNHLNSEIDAVPAVLRREYKVVKKLAADEKWRESEFILEPNQRIFVYGMVFKKDGEDVLREDERCPLIISRKNKERYLSEFFKGPSLWYFSNAIIVMGWILLMLGIAYFLPGLFLPGVLVGIAIVCIQTPFKIYNRLVLLRERAKNSASEIDIQLKKRADLLPRLIEVVRGYAKHEKELNELITRMRSDLLFYPTSESDKKQLIAILEAYPKLQASENFKSLMEALEKLEESIAQVREFYNRSVLKYNTLCQQFPGVLIALVAGMKPMRFLDRYELG